MFSTVCRMGTRKFAVLELYGRSVLLSAVIRSKKVKLFHNRPCRPRGVWLVKAPDY